MPQDRHVTAQIGPQLRCKGWRQESLLRMLENNLENGERPEDLVIYGGDNKAARNWESFDRIVLALRDLETHETLVVQSGKPIGIYTTSDDAPLVVMANGLTAGANEDEVQQLVERELIVRPGMTAAAWQYIGSQGIIQGTYETFMAAARQHFDGSLSGRKILTAGSGGMGGGQPLAGTLAGASILVADVEAQRLQRRCDEGYLDRMTDDLTEAIETWEQQASRGEAGSIGVVANIVDVLEVLEHRNVVPDITTDQTTTDPLYGYVPVGLSAEDCVKLRHDDPAKMIQLCGETVKRHVEGLLNLQRKGSVVFEYGNGLRERGLHNGVTDAMDIGGFIDLFIRPMFCEGIGPFRLLAIDGEPETIYRIDQQLSEMFADVPRVTEWLSKARAIKFTGLPARICWLGHEQRTAAALAINDLIARGEITGPVAFTRDHLDAGSVTARYRETENMADGSDCVGDWPILNALLDGVAGADLIAVHGLGQRSLNAGPTTIADGTPEAAERLSRVMHADSGLGVQRQADAGHDIALSAQTHYGLDLDTRLATVPR